MNDIFSYLEARSYPGRGILLGATPSGKPVAVYFIMGRSENSRNRVFTLTEDGIRTEAHDVKKLSDPSLIIYHPVRRFGDRLIVTNGDQTDTIRDYLTDGKDMYAALQTREFEPDMPNYTPRISGVLEKNGSYALSILKAGNNGAICRRIFFEYSAATPGGGHFISTYEGFGEPLPSFSGEPVFVGIGEYDAKSLAYKLWKSLNADNRVSLYVNIGGEIVMKNKNLGD